MADTKMVITEQYVDHVLYELINETPGLYFARNRDSYTEPVAKEIKKCLAAAKKTPTDDSDRFGTDKMRQKLEYLLACKKEKTVLEKFDPRDISERLHQCLFGMDQVIKEMTEFYYTEFLQGKRLNANLAVCGGPGRGKTSIVRELSRLMGYKHVKVSLNGIEDMKELRGFLSSYIGSEPGRFIKAIKEAGSTRLILQLDELDKLKSEYAMAILDLLDREFTDNFLAVPVDLSQTIFIATANDWANVPAVLRDRFSVIEVDGYTRNEKNLILSNYIIPKLENATKGVTISIEKEAKDYLLKTYANSFGVRDVEKAMQRICSGKLLDQFGTKDSTTIMIRKKDVRTYLGAEPIPRGNFPENGSIPGISKALAVSNGNVGTVFAIETALIEGKEETLEITGLPKESAVDSVKIAVTCLRKEYPELLKGKNIHVHFGEGAIQKDGPSAGVALYMSIFSAAIGKPIMDKKPYDIAYTGEISLTGCIYAVGGIFEKIQAACDSGCCKVFIPMQNYVHMNVEKLKEFDCKVIPVMHIGQVIEAIYPELKDSKIKSNI